MGQKSCLIAEDVQTKHDEVKAVVSKLLPDWMFVHAHSVVEAQDLSVSKVWDLIIMDISMDISSTAGAVKSREAHANTGGLDIIEQLYLLEKITPTVIVTGFDYFIRSDGDSEVREAQTFDSLKVQAERWLGTNYLGCIRYGKAGWEQMLESAIRGARL